MVGDRQDTGKVVLPMGWQHLTSMVILLALPTIWPGPLGWMQGLLAIPIMSSINELGAHRTYKLLTNAVLAATAIAALIGSLPALVFACTMLPVGIIIGNAYDREESPTKSGLKAVAVLLILWLTFWIGYGAATHTNPYREMLSSMDESLTAVATMYQSDAKLSLNDKEEIAGTIQLLREFLLQIAPALLATTAVITVWLNMLMGQWLLNRKATTRSKWPQFRYWRLPEQLVWVVIGSGIAALVPNEQVKTYGTNVLIAVGSLYFLQGVAVLAKLFAKWSVPRPMRAFLFAIAMLQGAGFVALAALGVADIWADFGTPRPDHDTAV